MPMWPFIRRFAGLVDGLSVPAAADLEALDEQLSRAANGLVYSDVALVKNFNPPTNIANAKNSLTYDPKNRDWYLLGDTTSVYTAFVSRDRGRTWQGLTLGSMSIAFLPTCMATDGAGTFVFGI